jgi:hypothetical protein
MDTKITDEILEELASSFEKVEAQSAALIQFLKDRKLATDEDLAPYLAQAAGASSVRWRALRVRFARLLSDLEKQGAEAPEQIGARTQKPAPDKAEASQQKKASPSGEKQRDKKAASGDHKSAVSDEREAGAERPKAGHRSLSRQEPQDGREQSANSDANEVVPAPYANAGGDLQHNERQEAKQQGSPQKQEKSAGQTKQASADAGEETKAQGETRKTA